MSGILIHEWIEPSGGAEKVLDSMARAFPSIDIQCLWNDAPERYPGHRVRETWLAKTPLRSSKALALPFIAPTWRRLEAPENYDWMLVSSHLFAHHARLTHHPDIPKFVYAHTPARYIWTPELDERGAQPHVKAVAPMFRRLDRRRAQEPTAIASNSDFVRQRIAEAWGRDSQVIYPPVSTETIRSQVDWRDQITDPSELEQLQRLPEEFILGVSRFIPYKRLDLVIHAGAAAGVPVVIAGSGPEEETLRQLAKSSSVPVHFVIFPSEAFLFALFQLAQVFVFPPVEDFGIVPVEAQASGTPVVVGPVGGQTETLIPGVSGIVADSTSPADLGAATIAARELPRFDAASVTQRFSEAEFTRKIRAFVGELP